MSYVEKEQLLPEARCGFRSRRSTTDMILVISRLQELGRKEHVPLYMFFVDLQKAYESIDRVFLWAILNRLGVSPKIISIIRQFHDGMRACVRLDDSKASDQSVQRRTTGMRPCLSSLYNLIYRGPQHRREQLHGGSLLS